MSDRWTTRGGKEARENKREGVREGGREGGSVETYLMNNISQLLLLL